MMENLPEYVSALIALLAMGGSCFFANLARKQALKQTGLQRFQVRQELRRDARMWADEVLIILQDGITHCIVFKQHKDGDDVSLKFTQLAGKMSELIDRGRWHFENDKQSGFGRWKEGAYQGLIWPFLVKRTACVPRPVDRAVGGWLCSCG